jgi:hypothetical protein
MACKCGAETMEGHQQKVESGAASAHVYSGHYWDTADGPWYEAEA